MSIQAHSQLISTLPAFLRTARFDQIWNDITNGSIINVSHNKNKFRIKIKKKWYNDDYIKIFDLQKNGFWIVSTIYLTIFGLDRIQKTMTENEVRNMFGLKYVLSECHTMTCIKKFGSVNDKDQFTELDKNVWSYIEKSNTWVHQDGYLSFKHFDFINYVYVKYTLNFSSKSDILKF